MLTDMYTILPNESR